MSEFRRRLLITSRALLAAILALLVYIECLQVVLRYLFGIGLFWAADVTLLLLLCLAWLGAAHLWATRSHLSIDFFGNDAPWYRSIINNVSDLLIVAGTIWLLPAYFSTLEIYSTIVMPALNLPVAVKYLPPGVGLLLITGLAACNLIAVCRATMRQQRKNR